jgi:hypothetical protein
MVEMDQRTFRHRAETFGFDTTTPWAFEALRLLYNVPRAYEPLVLAWERHHRGSRRTLERLNEMGFVAYQGPVIMDTRSGAVVEQTTRAVTRYVTTARGRRLLEAAAEDLRAVERAFPRTSGENLNAVLAMLEHLTLSGSHAQYGLSSAHAVELSGLADRTGRWWLGRLVAAGHVRALPRKVADAREVIPAHWRPTRLLTRQLSEVFEAFNSTTATLRHEFRLGRSRYLDDIDPARLGISGATDFDHDVQAQRILASLLLSPRCVTAGRVVVEPRYALPLRKASQPWEFDPAGPSVILYQPDAEMRERDENGQLKRCVVEYERYQTRRDGWSHIERFLGHLHTNTVGVEPAVLRFVVDSRQRVQSYVELIEAFADWALDHPDRMPCNNVQLAVAQASSVISARDPLDPRHWYRIALPQPDSATSQPVMHQKGKSPYEAYFTLRG